MLNLSIDYVLPGKRILKTLEIVVTFPNRQWKLVILDMAIETFDEKF